MRPCFPAVLFSVALLAACSPSQPQDAPATQQTVSLRTLTNTSASAEERDSYTIQGDLIPTPSDPTARYFVLFQKEVPLDDTMIAILRQERNHRISYARIELDCNKRLFHVVGVGNRRSFAETNITYDGPLRSIEGLPLRQELASFICRTNRTPLAPPPRT